MIVAMEVELTRCIDTDRRGKNREHGRQLSELLWRRDRRVRVEDRAMGGRWEGE
jgi:hypothetical protein